MEIYGAVMTRESHRAFDRRAPATDYRKQMRDAPICSSLNYSQPPFIRSPLRTQRRVLFSRLTSPGSSSEPGSPNPLKNLWCDDGYDCLDFSVKIMILFESEAG